MKGCLFCGVTLVMVAKSARMKQDYLRKSERRC